MTPLFLVLLLAVQMAVGGLLDETQLEFAFMVHRHGDRTPTTASMSLVSGVINVTKATELIDPYGYGQLSNIGEQTAYKLGQNIRLRYDELISKTYNKSEIYIRSTDVTRTKMTILVAMSATYIPNQIAPGVCKTPNWVPVPYTTVPIVYDYNGFYVNCPEYLNLSSVLYKSAPEEFDQYSCLLSNLTSELNIGLDLNLYPIYTYPIYDVLVALNNLGYTLPDEINRWMPMLGKAAGLAMKYVYGDISEVQLKAGPLLNEFFETSQEVLNGSDTKRLRIYSAHDVNVFAFRSITLTNPKNVPKYAALYSLEVRRLKKTGQLVVVAVYIPSPDEQPEYLEIEGCGKVCPLDKFKELTSGNALTESDWRVQCKFTSADDIDTSTIE